MYLLTGPDSHLQFIDTTSNVQELAFLSDVQSSNASVTAETNRAEAAEATLTASIATTNTNLSGEIARATSAELALGASITSDEAAIAAANTAISTETTRAQGQEALKANLAGGNLFTTGKQILAPSTSGYASINVPAGVLPTTIAAGDVYLLTGPDSHLQFIDTTSNVQELAFLSDVQSSNASVTAETNRAEGVEATLTASIATTNTNLSGEIARATSAELALGASITSDEAAIAAANTAISTETTRAQGQEALKANLAGGNLFTTGKQILAPSTSGYASINVPAGVLPTTIAAGDMYLLTGRDSHLQFIDTTSNVQELAFLSDVRAPTLPSRQRPTVQKRSKQH